VAAELGRARERGAARVELAPPRDNPGALAFCAALGFAYSSSLWQLVLDPAAVMPPPSFPPAIATRPLRPGADDEPFVALFNAAFAEHPSPMQVTLEMVRHAHARPAFDPDLLLVLTPVDQPTDLLGFGRLSIVHEDNGASNGHIDLLGVAPEWRGRGLGRELLRWSVQTLRARDVAQLDLAVEARNERALALYERAGFTRAQEWPRWARDVDAV
jgi:mycothiol synthase